MDPADLDLDDAARPFPPSIAPTKCRTSPTGSNAINPIRGTRLAAGLVNSCPQRVDRLCELLTRIVEGIRHGFFYRRRETKGIQQPIETLRLGHGSCRDFAVLMIEAARSLGLAARFASGYMPSRSTIRRNRRAARSRLDPCLGTNLSAGAGWIDFDPSSGSVGKIGLVTVAVVRDPRHATPLHGTFIGFPSDHLDMEVQVTITSRHAGGDLGQSRRSPYPQFGQPV